MLEIKNVKIEYYGQELAVLNFAFTKGVTIILGEVGSFKTTLLRIVGGIKEFSEGEIVLDGTNIEEIPPKKRDMAYVGADSLPYGGSVYKALMYPLRLRGENKKTARAAAMSAADKFKLEPKRKIKKLTEGELISFFGARLSLRKTNVTMFDEPYHYFGEQNADIVTDMIKSRDGYVLVTSCDGEDVKRLNPDYLVVLRGDKVLLFGATKDVIESADQYVSMLLNM